jgi:CheY-like chemotaxis protein
LKKILIADGMLENAEKIENFLKEEFEVCKSCSEQGVLDLCLMRDFDLVICGYALRDITGTELIKKIKGVLPDIKSILISGSLIPDEKEIKELGINAFIEKPFEMDALKHVVDLVLEG